MSIDTIQKLNKEQVGRQMKERLRMRRLALKEIKEWVKFYKENENIIAYYKGFAYRTPKLKI